MYKFLFTTIYKLLFTQYTNYTIDHYGFAKQNGVNQRGSYIRSDRLLKQVINIIHNKTSAFFVKLVFAKSPLYI
jgi:hypothetical protein